MEKTQLLKLYDNSSLDEDLRVRIQQKWTLRRLFLWLRGKVPYHGESLLLAQILQLSCAIKPGMFPERIIKRVIKRDFEEQDLEGCVKTWLVKQAK